MLKSEKTLRTRLFVFAGFALLRVFCTPLNELMSELTLGIHGNNFKKLVFKLAMFLI